MTTQKLTNAEITAQLESVPGWKTRDRRRAIHRTFSLPGFRSSLAFVAWVGELSEAVDHHPDIDVRWNKVTLALSTHSAGGLTSKDFELARLINL